MKLKNLIRKTIIVSIFNGLISLRTELQGNCSLTAAVAELENLIVKLFIRLRLGLAFAKRSYLLNGLFYLDIFLNVC